MDCPFNIMLKMLKFFILSKILLLKQSELIKTVFVTDLRSYYLIKVKHFCENICSLFAKTNLLPRSYWKQPLVNATLLNNRDFSQSGIQQLSFKDGKKKALALCGSQLSSLLYATFDIEKINFSKENVAILRTMF